MNITNIIVITHHMITYRRCYHSNASQEVTHTKTSVLDKTLLFWGCSTHLALSIQTFGTIHLDKFLPLDKWSSTWNIAVYSFNLQILVVFEISPIKQICNYHKVNALENGSA